MRAAGAVDLPRRMPEAVVAAAAVATVSSEVPALSPVTKEAAAADAGTPVVAVEYSRSEGLKRAEYEWLISEVCVRRSLLGGCWAAAGGSASSFFGLL